MKKLFEKCLISIFTFFPILIILERYIPFLSTILTGLVLISSLFIMLSKQNKIFIIKYTLVLFCYWYNLRYVTDVDLHRSYLIFLIYTMLIFDLCKNKDYIKNVFKAFYGKCELIEAQLWICMIINVITVFISYGYSDSYSQVWSLNAYKGIYVDPHQLGYRLCAMIILLNILILIKNRPRYIFLLVGFEILILLSGARVPTVMALILGLLSIKFMDIKIINKNKIILRYSHKIGIVAICICILIGIIGVLSQTSFIKKMQVTLAAQDFDSGRSDLKEIDLAYFKSADKDKQLFGSGTEKTYKLHKEKAYAEIWSHNDFLQILVGMGIVSLIIYAVSIISICIIFFFKKNIIYYLVGLSILFLAWSNGLFIHPRFVCMIPLLMATINTFEEVKYLELSK